MEDFQKLHSRAIWLFFFSYIWKIIFLYIFLRIFFAPFIFMKNFGKNLGFQEQPISFSGYLFFNLGKAALIFLALVIIAYIGARLTYHFYRYQLADGAIKIEKGVIWKKYISIPYERIQNIDIYRGVIARILGLSDIHIQTAGYSVGGKGPITEGRLPGLNIKTAEDLREELVKRVQGKKQGL